MGGGGRGACSVHMHTRACAGSRGQWSISSGLVTTGEGGVMVMVVWVVVVGEVPGSDL